MAERTWGIRDDEGLPDGTHVGIGYLMTTTHIDDDQRRYEWAYDCGCRFMKLRSEGRRCYVDLSEDFCPTHWEPDRTATAPTPVEDRWL